MSEEFKQNEKKVEESEKKYRDLVNNLTDINLEVNVNGIVTYVSPQCYNIMGYQPMELLGKNALNYIHPEDVLKIAEAMKLALQTSERISVPKYKLLHKNGNIIYASAKGKYVKTNESERFIVTIQDITSQILVEQKLKESEEKYRSLIDNLTDIILELDINGTITYISPQCYNIVGYQQNELVGKKALKYIHPKDVLKLVESMKNARDTKKLIAAPDFKLIHKNGNIVYSSARGKHVITNGMDRYIVTLRDITTKKKIELKLKESEEKYRLISENANELILIVSETLNIEYVNKKPLLKIAGYSIDEVIGKRALNFLHLDDKEKSFKQFYEAFNKEGHGIVEAKVRHREGHYFHVEINGSLFHNEKGEPKGLLITRDITERKKAENLIIEEYKKLEELSQIKSELIMQASHELKTPLSSIYAASQILLQNYKETLDHKPLEFIEMIYRGSQKLRQLIENLLDVSKIESGKFNLNLQKENIIDFIHECCSDLQYWAEKKNINIKFELPEEVFVKIDKVRVEQVITNLLSNAIKFTPPNGNIYINLNVIDQWVEISIKDTGIGLVEKEKKLLFEKFGKIKRVIKDKDIDVEGSGLGLYISKRIVSLHQGMLLVKSDGRNKGSTFTIRLPLSK